MMLRCHFFLCILIIAIASDLFAASLPDGFEETLVVSNINAETAFTILPDGRLIYAEQTGYLRLVVNEELIPEPALDMSERVATD